MADYHSLNKILPRDENGVTELEEKFSFLYTSDKNMGGDPIKVLLYLNYHPSINQDTPQRDLQKVATEIMEKKSVKKRILYFLEGRDNQFVYDKVFIMSEFKRVYHACMGDDRPYDLTEEGEKFEPDVKTAKGVLDSMAKTLGMMQNVEVKMDAVDDPQAKLRKAAERGNAARMMKMKERNAENKTA